MKNSKLLIFFGFLGVFLLFFLQYPLQNSFTGNLDTLANLAMYKQLKMYIDGLFTSDIYGTLCYPLKNVLVYFGADFGAGIIHVFFNYLGFPDLWANWMFISIVFALNSFALYLFLNIYFKDKKIAISGSLLFSFSHFILANLENPNALFFCFFFLSLYYYELYLNSEAKNNKLLYRAAFLGCIQIYLSPYLFLFHAIVWAIIILFKETKRIFTMDFIIKYFKIGILYLIVISPFLYFFVFNDALNDSHNPIAETDYSFLFSIGIDDFLRVLPNHLYLEYHEIWDNPFISKIKSAYIGIAFYLMGIYGFFKTRNKFLWLTVFIVSLIIAIGPFLVKDLNTMWPSIMYPFYHYLGFGDILRVPSRGFFIVVLALTVMTTYGLQYIKNRYPKYPFWLIPVFLILLENVPLKMEMYDQNHYIHPDPAFIEYEIQHPNDIVLSVPTQLGTYIGDQNEYTYMYWQYFHKRSILNGNLAFIPISRLQTDYTVRNMTANLLKDLIKSHGITTIVYHKDLKYEINQSNQLEILRSFSDFLEPQIETDRVVIFKVNTN